jgi:hypothetical protein
MNTVYIGSTLVNDIFLANKRIDEIGLPKGPLSIEYLIVGAGGEAFNGGGGGAQYVTGSTTLSTGTYPVVAAKITTGTPTQTQVSGAYSSFLEITSKGGGNGGEYNASAALARGWDGACGGGGAGAGGAAPSGVGGTGTAGGNGGTASNINNGGGGGGASGSAAGSTPGLGKQWLDGNYYCGGGYGYNHSGETILGASPNGGGGGLWNSGPSGPGTVRIRYAGSGSQATGGTIIYSGSYTYHTFTGSSASSTTGNFVY